LSGRTAFPITTSTTAAGHAAVTTPLPSASALEGLVFYDQWLVVPSGTAGCSAFGTDFSNAIAVVIQ